MNPAKIPAILPGKLPERKIIIVDDENNDGEEDDDNIAVDVREEIAVAAAVSVAGMVGVEAVIGAVVGIVGVATSSKTEIKIYERQLEKILYE